MQVQAESFHLNGHIIRFRPQTQKLESPYKTPSSTPAVKGLTESSAVNNCWGSFVLLNLSCCQNKNTQTRLKYFLKLRLKKKTFFRDQVIRNHGLGIK